MLRDQRRNRVGMVHVIPPSDATASSGGRKATVSAPSALCTLHIDQDEEEERDEENEKRKQGGRVGLTVLTVLGLAVFGVCVVHAGQPWRSNPTQSGAQMLKETKFQPRAARSVAEERKKKSEEREAGGGRALASPSSPSSPFIPSSPMAAPAALAAIAGGAAAHAGQEDCTGSAGMPHSIKTLCTVVKRGVWPRMQAFFSADADAAGVVDHPQLSRRTPPPRLKVAVLNLEETSKQGTLEASPCAKKFNRTYFEGRMQTKDYAQKFASELLIPIAMKASPYFWDDPMTADWIVVEHCSIGRAKQGQLQQQIPSLMQKTKWGPEVWAQRRDRVLLTLTGDHGPCTQSNEKLGQFRERPWIEPRLKGIPMMLNEGSTQGGCYTPGKDFTVPSTAVVSGSHDGSRSRSRSRVARSNEGEGGDAYATEDQGGGGGDGTGDTECATLPLSKRRHLGFFAGKIDSEVRKDLYKIFADNVEDASKDAAADDINSLYFPKSANKTTYRCGLKSSVFCIAPRGNAAWSPRLDEAMDAECIPVIMADNYDPPWSSVLDYSTFSVRIEEKRVNDVAKILTAIPAEERERLHSNLQRAKKVFRWSAWNTTPYGEDGTPMLAFELWQRRTNRSQRR